MDSEVTEATCFDPACTRCPRLVDYLSRLRSELPSYHAQPVPGFGAARPRLMLVGLAPGMHGANRTGRPFVGDEAGELLFDVLFEAGLSTAASATGVGSNVRLKKGCRITNAVKCVPPKNRPVAAEIANCNAYLRAELTRMPRGGVILALGTIAHGAVLRALGLARSKFPFAHGGEFSLPREQWLVDSYHCSRYNTNTRRLTRPMFEAVVARARSLARISRADRAMVRDRASDETCELAGA